MYLQPLPQNETNTETYSNWQNEGISTCIKWSYHVLIKFVMCLNFWKPEAFCPTIRIIVYHKSCLFIYYIESPTNNRLHFLLSLLECNSVWYLVWCWSHLWTVPHNKCLGMSCSSQNQICTPCHIIYKLFILSVLYDLFVTQIYPCICFRCGSRHFRGCWDEHFGKNISCLFTL